MGLFSSPPPPPQPPPPPAAAPPTFASAKTMAAFERPALRDPTVLTSEPGLNERQKALTAQLGIQGPSANVGAGGVAGPGVAGPGAGGR